VEKMTRGEESRWRDRGNSFSRGDFLEGRIHCGLRKNAAIRIRPDLGPGGTFTRMGNSSGKEVVKVESQARPKTSSGGARVRG